MAFEVFHIAARRMPPNMASISKDGRIRFYVDDLKRVGIEKSATVMIDRINRRIAFRKPRGGEPTVAMSLSKKSPESVTVKAATVIRHLGLNPTACKGRVGIEYKDDFVAIQIGNIEGV